jgi:hypothetical protein
MRTRHNRLTTRTDSVVAVKADTNFRSALEYLIGKYGARNQAEIIYQSVFLLANQLGYRTPLGGLLLTLEHLQKEEEREKEAAHARELEEAVESGVMSLKKSMELKRQIEEALMR